MSTSSPIQAKTLGGVLLTILILVILASGIDLMLLRPIVAGHLALTVFIERCFYWLFVAVLWLYATKEEKQPLLIWKENKYSIGTHISHLFALFFIIMISINLINFLIPFLRHEPPSKLAPRLAIFFRKYPFLLVFTALTAGVTEELVFRGYLQPRLELLFKNPYWAIVISSLIFGLAHIMYGTVKNVIDPFFIGLGLAIYYWRYRNIKVAMVFHFLWDLLGLLFVMKIGAKQ